MRRVTRKVAVLNRAKLPVGVMFQSGISVSNDHNQNFGPNWAVLLLPYIEQGNLFSQASTSIQNYMTTPNESGWRSIVGTNIKIYRCPSDSYGGTPLTLLGRTWGRGNYGANAGTGMFWATGDSQSGLAYSNNLLTDSNATVGYTGTPSGGVMTGNFGVAIELISDGSSNTVMIDEIRVGTASNDLRGAWALGQSGASIVAASGRADSPGPNISPSGGDDINSGVDDWQHGMGACLGCGNNQVTMKSLHTGGAHACFADGSVRFIRNSINITNYTLIHCRNDGQVLNGNDF